MVQLTSDSFPSGSFSLHHHEWIFFFSGKHNLTLIKILNITEVFQKQIWWRSHGTEKNHLRNMVKENDTWQFTNWPFQISKRPTRAQPHSSSSHEYSDWQLVWDRSAGTAPPTSFSCFCYRLKNFLALEIHLLWGKKIYIFTIWAYLSIKYPAGEVLVVERVQVGRLSNSGCEAMFNTVKLPWCPALWFVKMNCGQESY